MNIRIATKNGVGMLDAFAAMLQTSVKEGRVTVPEQYGNGFMQGVIFDEQFRMLIMDYQLTEPHSIARKIPREAASMLIFTFCNSIYPKASGNRVASHGFPSVQITTQGLDGQELLPSNTRRNQMAIAIDALYLKSLIGNPVDSPILSRILENKEQLLFEELLFEPLLHVIEQIVHAHLPADLGVFYYKIKCQELLCLLMAALVHRDEKTFAKTGISSLKALYQVKDYLLKDLARQPRINELALLAAMSESKLKRLFKQVFGQSIFNYYQRFRIQEAARLLREERISVSEAGYRLGFSNMSHFTRAFEMQMGTKPKKYAMR